MIGYLIVEGMVMISPLSQKKTDWIFSLVMLFLIVFVVVLKYMDRKNERRAINMLMSIPSQSVISVKIHPNFEPI